MIDRTLRATTAGFAALLIAAGVADAQSCDPSDFDTSPSGYDDLQEERFESTGYDVGDAFGECHGCESSTLILPGLVIFPEDDTAAVILQEDCDGSIPMDSMFAAGYVGRIVLFFSDDEEKAGFFYGSRTNDVSVTVDTSDGQSRTFNLTEADASTSCGADGYEGFFGYCTGSSAVSIERMIIDVAEGGIDKIRCANCAKAVPVEAARWSDVKVRF